MLKKWIKKNAYTKEKFCKKVDISRPTLDRILNGSAKEVFYTTAVKIKDVTGLNPWDYIPGLDETKTIVERNWPG